MQENEKKFYSSFQDRLWHSFALICAIFILANETQFDVDYFLRSHDLSSL